MFIYAIILWDIVEMYVVAFFCLNNSARYVSVHACVCVWVPKGVCPSSPRGVWQSFRSFSAIQNYLCKMLLFEENYFRWGSVLYRVDLGSHSMKRFDNHWSTTEVDLQLTATASANRSASEHWTWVANWQPVASHTDTKECLVFLY